MNVVKCEATVNGGYKYCGGKAAKGGLSYAPCAMHTDCQSNLCYEQIEASDAKWCVPPLGSPEGVSCTDDSDCESNTCLERSSDDETAYCAKDKASSAALGKEGTPYAYAYAYLRTQFVYCSMLRQPPTVRAAFRR